MLKALSQLKDRKDQFDMVLLETTGLANPAPVVATFTQNATVANHFRVDGIVCLVDAKHVGGHLAEKKADDAVNESVCQVAFADLRAQVAVVEVCLGKGVVLGEHLHKAWQPLPRGHAELIRLLEIAAACERNKDAAQVAEGMDPLLGGQDPRSDK